MSNKTKSKSPVKQVATVQKVVGSQADKSSELHPRNRHHARYDFARLIAADAIATGSNNTCLQQFVSTNAHGEDSIDFADPAAVKALNRALLKDSYGVNGWDIPAANLCPPVPGRVDYLHYIADLLTASNQGRQIKKKNIRVLDIGTGANGIYPLLGASEYAWQFVATDINRLSLANVQMVLDANPALAEKISLRLQIDPNAIFRNIIEDDDWFDLSMCNPPFHTSLAEAKEGTQRKWSNLGKTTAKADTNLNFGGQDAELWCPGGELAFIQKMIKESAGIATRCFWFSTLVSKSTHLPAISAALKQAKVQGQQTINMQQGQKQSRLVAWTFLNSAQQAAWAKLRW